MDFTIIKNYILITIEKFLPNSKTTFDNADDIIKTFTKTVSNLDSFVSTQKEKADSLMEEAASLTYNANSAITEMRKASRYSKKLNDLFGQDED